MSTVTVRNYGRAVRQMNFDERRVVVGGRPNEIVTFAHSGGKQVRVHVVFETAVHTDYGSWGIIRTKDDLAATSRRFDASGFRWNQLYERVARWLAADRNRDYEQHFRRLAEIRQLAKGWDSYDAEPPSEVACEVATTLLASLKQHDLPVAFVTATSDASIMLKHHAAAAVVTWEIDEDGEIGVIVERAGAEPEYFSPNACGIRALVADLARNG